MGVSAVDLTRSETLYERAQHVIPGGIPGIRSPDNYVRGAYPILLEGGQGGRIVDVDGNEYVDLLLGYGPIVLGHGERTVDDAAAQQARTGFCLNLPEPIMVELAEQLVSLVPCAEQVLFFKTGSGATSGAVRLARTHTGRSVVLRCGYHGWHDWCLEGDPGVPQGASQDVIPFRYNDLDQLEALLKAHSGEVAAIILTPIGHEFDRQIEPPAAGFLDGVRHLSDQHGAVLIFDEVRSGFRVHPGGAQALYGTTPDLTALGKALGNGYAITALVGRRDVMAAAGRTFISSTYFGNGMEMAAALETLRLITEVNVLDEIHAKGRRLRAGLESVMDESGLPVTLSPYPEMPFVHFDARLDANQDRNRSRFYAALAQAGVFAHPRHHGFLCWRHSQADLDQILAACRQAAGAL
jgi:glutamate-1-semialdehyde aminotransferase